MMNPCEAEQPELGPQSALNTNRNGNKPVTLAATVFRPPNRTFIAFPQHLVKHAAIPRNLPNKPNTSHNRPVTMAISQSTNPPIPTV